jgi:hypothetical protein
MPANVGQMFYYGEVPWHGGGKHVNSPLTIHQALQHGGLIRLTVLSRSWMTATSGWLHSSI